MQKLEPACAVEVDRDGVVTDRWRYYELPLRCGAVEATVGDLEERLRSAVRRTLVSDVEVGVLLSGGIDSSLTAWFASEASPGLRAFTVRFDDPSRDESRHALAVGRELGIDVELLDVRSNDALELVEALPSIYDEPFADQSAIPTVLLAREVSSHVKVALGGDGGDELFNGYVMYAEADRVRRIARFVPDSLLASVESLSTSSSVPLGRLGNAASRLQLGDAGALGNVRSIMTPSARRLLLGPASGSSSPGVSWSSIGPSSPDGPDDRWADLRT